LGEPAIKNREYDADHFRSNRGLGTDEKDGPHMELFVSWTRSTVANIERTLSHADDYFDRILIGVIALLALVVAILFL